MNKFLTVACFVVLASPAFAQGMAAPAPTKDGMAGPMANGAMATNDTMKMDHKKAMKKPAMKHDAMGAGMAAPSSSMSGPNH
jgi:pentapeptide MXKDX repeat protein